MAQQSDEIVIILACRQYLYQLFQHAFGHEPSLEWIKAAVSDHTQDTLTLFFHKNESEPDTYLNFLWELRQSVAVDPRGVVDRLVGEYTYLMLGGMTKLPAPPWESVYLSDDKTLFKDSTLRVRQAYLAYQFLPANYPHEADDHIALELDFMAHLARMTQERFDSEDINAVKRLLSDQKRFLEEHLLVWIGDFAERIQQSKTHRLYPQTAAVTEQVLKLDAAVLDELICVISSAESAGFSQVNEKPVCEI